MLKKLPKPILEPSKEGFDSKNVYNPSVIYVREKFIMLYRAEGEDNVTGRIGLALSEDGINFVKHPEPVMEPEYQWEKKGIEDPRVVKLGKRYVMTYTGYDGRIARLCIAVSKNLLSWEKGEPLFPNFPGNRLRPRGWTKSGAILPQKINGEYIMYFGDSNIWIAYSSDGIHWEYYNSPVMKPRKGKFDSLLVEPGPPPILTEDSIVLFYNSANENLVYRVGVALFDRDEPWKVKIRSRRPILEPEYPWELEGHVDNVVFLEGFVDLGNRLLFYYGGADKYVGLATWEGDLTSLLKFVVG